MKHGLPTTALFAASILLLVASCAGAPKATPPEKPAEPVAEAPTTPAPTQSVIEKPATADVDALAAAKARAEKSRKQAFDVDSPSFFPDEWKAAETAFLAVYERKVEETPAFYREATKDYTAAADTYDALAGRALPLYAEARRAEIAAARERAVEAGIEESSPERLAAADAAAAKAQGLFEAGDYYPAAAAAMEARDRYLALAPGAKAYAVKSEIDSRDFTSADPSNYSLADKKLGEALAAYDAGEQAASRDAAEESLLRFNLALKKGWEQYVSERRVSADTERKAALDLKANVAVKAAFDSASSVFGEADTAFQAEEYEDAADLYSESAGLFAVVSGSAAEKRLAAETAIAEAERRVGESERTALEADALLEGGTR